MLTLRQVIQMAATLTDEQLDNPMNLQVETVDQHGNSTLFIVPVARMYLLQQDNYIGPSGVFGYEELDQMLLDDLVSGEPSGESLEDYSLYIKKDQPVLYAYPVHYEKPEGNHPELVYSYCQTRMPEQPCPPVPHLKVEKE